MLETIFLLKSSENADIIVRENATPTLGLATEDSQNVCIANMKLKKGSDWSEAALGARDGGTAVNTGGGSKRLKL